MFDVTGLVIYGSWAPLIGFGPVIDLAETPLNPGYWSLLEFDLIDIGGTIFDL